MNAPSSGPPAGAPASATHHVSHPAISAVATKRASDIQLVIADRITAFAGSMWFVYLHAAAFAMWMLVGEKSPWPTLTLVVSLEAIFLSTFVMIGQNRQAQYQQALAQHDFVVQEQELHDNSDLTRQARDLAAQIKTLTEQIHAQVVPSTDDEAVSPGT